MELKTEFANFYSAMAYPGSPLYRQAVANGWALPATWSGYSQHSVDTLPLPTRHVPAGEVLKFRDAAFQRTGVRASTSVGDRSSTSSGEPSRTAVSFSRPGRYARYA